LTACPREEGFQLGRSSSVGIGLVDESVKLSFGVAERIYVIREGHIVMEGTTDELSADKEIRKTSLGV